MACPDRPPTATDRPDGPNAGRPPADPADTLDIRPITAVRTVKAGTTIRAWAGPNQGTCDIPAEQFASYIATPPHSDYVSGHSTLSAAASRILRLFTDSDTLNMSATIGAGTSTVEPARSQPPRSD